MKLMLSILLVAVVTPGPAGAGVAGLDLAPTARAAAMGMAGTAGDTDPAGILFNPAAAAGHHGVAVNSAYANWTGDVDQFVNAFSWAGPAGPVTLGGALAHTRLEFKTFAAEYGYLPFNTQSSFLTAAMATRWSGRLGSLSAGTSLAWDTSEGGGDKTLVDAGVRIEGPTWSSAGWSARGALAASALHGGADAVPASGDHGFARGPGGEQVRYGVSFHATAGAVSVQVNGDAVDFDGRGTATAAGIECAVLESVHARAGYGDNIVGGRDAVTLGVGVGHDIGDLEIRADYARVETNDDSLTANVFGVRLALTF